MLFYQKANIFILQFSLICVTLRLILIVLAKDYSRTEVRQAFFSNRVVDVVVVAVYFSKYIHTTIADNKIIHCTH